MEPANCERSLSYRYQSSSRNQALTNVQQKSGITRRFVLLLGLSGTGKTKFVRDVVESPNLAPNSYLQSDFGDSPIYTYKPKSRHNGLELVEPPAFDINPSGDWQQAVQCLCQWVTQMPKGCEIGGILYFHRISDDRMSGSSKRALRLLNALCGDSYMPNVRLVTTHWDLISKDIGETREAELRADYWADMIAFKAKVMRYQDIGDGKKILKSLGREVGRQTAPRPAIQQELKDGKSWEQTAAGDILRSENEKALTRRQQELIQTMEELVEASRTVTGLREKEEIQNNLLFFEEQLRKLMVPLTSQGETSDRLESIPIEDSSELWRSGVERTTPEELKEFEFSGPKREQTMSGNIGVLVQRLKTRTRQNVSDPKQERKFWESLKGLVSDMVKALNPITGASRLARVSTTRFAIQGTHPSLDTNLTFSPNQDSGVYGSQNIR